jgi:hypothetical protein
MLPETISCGFQPTIQTNLDPEPQKLQESLPVVPTRCSVKGQVRRFAVFKLASQTCPEFPLSNLKLGLEGIQYSKNHKIPAGPTQKPKIFQIKKVAEGPDPKKYRFSTETVSWNLITATKPRLKIFDAPLKTNIFKGVLNVNSAEDFPEANVKYTPNFVGSVIRRALTSKKNEVSSAAKITLRSKPVRSGPSRIYSNENTTIRVLRVPVGMGAGRESIAKTDLLAKLECRELDF